MQNIGLGSIQTNAVGQLADQKVSRAQTLERAGEAAKAAKEFEKLLSTMMVKQLRSTLKDGFFPKGPGNDAYNSWLDDAIGSSLAESGTLGLVGQLKAQLGSNDAPEVAGS
ncbi:MAG TPA: rod-binding protein [Planctomycetota bacterium]|nr:rod-binding protein [Planctomycetota bacterium]HRV80022.1 rod-binding protein [Planctomycetota bacterium]